MSYEDFLQTCLGKKPTQSTFPQGGNRPPDPPPQSPQKLSSPLQQGAQRYINWLKESPLNVEVWSDMMSTPSNIDNEVEIMKVLRQVSPDIKLETENVKTRWNEKENSVQLFLHFKGTREGYSII
jgi:hypothetical protein